MITHLHLQNFLRHEDAEIHLDPEHQLVVVSGDNGTGKSSIFNAVVWALYGDPPKGRRVDELVRRGAELEGCQVDLTFTVGEDSYHVQRRRDGRKTSAILHVNDAPVVEGASAVTEEVSRVLGMDVAGFRVAFVAEQGELDGLAALRPAERSKMLTRLLRLDAIDAAKLKARELYNNERRVVQALGAGLDIDELAQQLEQSTAERDLLDGQLAEARAAVAQLTERIEAGADVERRHADAVAEAMRAETRLESAQEALQAARDELEGLEVPDEVDLGTRSAGDIAAELRELEARVVRAESADELVSQRKMAQREVSRIEARLAELDAAEAELAKVPSVAEASEALDAAAQQRQEASLDLEEARDAQAAATVREDLAQRRLAELGELGASCDRCGQDVDDEHRQSMHGEATTAAAAAATARTDADAAVAEASAVLEEADRALEQARSRRHVATSAASRLEALTTERADLERRRATHRASIERLPEKAEDLDELYAIKGELAAEHAEALEAEEAARERSRLLERRGHLQSRVDALVDQVELAAKAAQAAAPDQELIDAHEQVARAKTERDGEREVVTHLAAAHAGAAERVLAAERDLDRAHRALDRRKQHQVRAQTAENAAMLLSEVSEILATQIRPALQGAVSDLLGRLSEGRFTECRISDSYDVQVLDDGAVVDLASLSGGEQDLVALAVRLGLAEVVTSRQGSGGIGTLVLDEVFGSQDASRQASIVNALRGLRDVYGQILLISHVGGLDEGADAVITVSTPPDRSHTEVHVA